MGRGRPLLAALRSAAPSPLENLCGQAMRALLPQGSTVGYLAYLGAICR